MASEQISEETYAERREQAMPKFIGFPKESAMQKLLHRLRSRFRKPSEPDFEDYEESEHPYHAYAKAEKEYESELVHHPDNIDKTIRHFIHQQYIFHSKVKGAKGPFPGFFRVVEDDEVEQATEQLVQKYKRYHPHADAKGQGGGSSPEWNQGARKKSVRAFLHTLKGLGRSERERLEAFQTQDVTDLNLNKAYAQSPLYRLMQKSGTKGGPYGFAVAMSQYRKPGASRDIFRSAKQLVKSSPVSTV